MKTKRSRKGLFISLISFVFMGIWITISLGSSLPVELPPVYIYDESGNLIEQLSQLPAKPLEQYILERDRTKVPAKALSSAALRGWIIGMEGNHLTVKNENEKDIYVIENVLEYKILLVFSNPFNPDDSVVEWIEKDRIKLNRETLIGLYEDEYGDFRVLYTKVYQH